MMKDEEHGPRRGFELSNITPLDASQPFVPRILESEGDIVYPSGCQCQDVQDGGDSICT
jgi:hypothetical protein